MHRQNLVGYLGIVTLFLAQACAPMIYHVKEVGNQSIEVTTNPSGATIWLRNQNGTHRLGPSPVKIKESYEAVVAKTDQGECAGVGAAHGMLIGLDAARDGKSAAILGVLGMMVGATAGAAACSGPDAVVSIEPNQFEIVATLDGYVPEHLVVEVPRESSKVHLDLIPVPKTETKTISHKTANVAPAPLRVDLLRLMPIEMDVIKGEKVPELPEALTIAFSEALESEGFEMETVQAAVATHQLTCRVMQMEPTCILSATISSITNGRPQKVVGARCACTQQELEKALQRMAKELAGKQNTTPGQPQQPATQTN